MTLAYLLVKHLEPDALVDKVKRISDVVKPGKPFYQRLYPGLFFGAVWYLEGAYAKYVTVAVVPEEKWDYSRNAPAERPHIYGRPWELYDLGAVGYPANPAVLKYDEAENKYAIHCNYQPWGLPIPKRYFVCAYFDPDDVKTYSIPSTTSVSVTLAYMAAEVSNWDLLIRAYRKLMQG